MCVCVCVCVCTHTTSLSIHLPMDIWALSIVWLLLIMLLWTSGCMCPFKSVIFYPLGKYPVVQLLGHRVALFLTFSFFKDFIYLFDRDRDSQWEREHKQGEWERKKQALSGGAWCGARTHNAGITPWAEGRRLTAVPPRRPQNLSFDSTPSFNSY